MDSGDTDRLIGTEVAGVTLLSLHGRGHTGLVFVGFQKSLKRKIAVKLVPKAKATAQSFMDEAEVVAVLNHPNIVTVFDVGEFGEYLYITMQLIEGDSLQGLLKRRLLHPVPSQRSMDATAVLPVMAATLDALEYAHQQGVIHQDIKPGNILIEKPSGRPYVADFGIARTELTEDQSKFVHGTPLYMPPEQARGHVTDQRADIFAVGVTMWECLAGVLPAPPLPAIKLVGMKARNPEAFFLKSPSESGARIDERLEQIILKATAPDRENRYGGCGQFKNALREYADGKLGLRI
ncbi:MAG: serine/threonine protein kinase [Chitinispirillia bacterium]|nr:serine/threonine protein kinase [Chitinispirillia bacterium]MCL2241313.1 serine/threonine protein kinase [Chitinispirillia bacterium]